MLVMLDLSPLAWRVMLRNLKVYTKHWVSSVMPNFFEPIFYLVALGIGLGAYVKEIQGVPYILFIAPGLIASSAMFATTFELIYGGYTRLSYQKTYDAILATPVSIDDLVAGEMLWGAVRSLVYGMLIFLVISFFGAIRSPWALAIPFVLVLGGLFFAAIALCFVAVAKNYDFFNYYLSMILFPMFMFSGIFFPLQDLPAWAQTIAWWTPLAHWVTLCRSLAYGAVDFSLLGHVLWFAVALVPAFTGALLLMRRRLVK